MHTHTTPPATARPWRLAALAIVGALALLAAACTDDGEDPAPTVPDTGTGPDSTDDLTAAEPAPRDPACEDPVQGLILRAPEGWDATPPDWGEPCRFFDPDAEPIRSGDLPPDDAAISLRVDVGPFDQVVADESSSAEADQEVDGRDAVRIDADEALVWIVDMREGRYLTARADTADPEVGTTLDEMIDSLRWIDPRTAGEGIDPISTPAELPSSSGDFPRLDDDVLVVSDLRSAGQDGFDRVVIELGGDDGVTDTPSFSVEEVTGPFIDPTNGATTPVDGEVFVEIRVAPATNTAPDGGRAYEGPDRVPSPDSEIIAEVVRLRAEGDEERVVVGLTETAPVAVSTLTDPSRLVVDIVHDEALVELER